MKTKIIVVLLVVVVAICAVLISNTSLLQGALKKNPARADIKITEVSTENNSTNCSVYFNVKIKNSGTAATTNTFSTVAEPYDIAGNRDNRFLVSETSSLAAGETITATTWIGADYLRLAGGGIQKIKFITDFDNTINETIESNNEFTYAIPTGSLDFECEE